MYSGSMGDEAESGEEKALLWEKEAIKADIDRLLAKKVAFKKRAGFSKIEKEIDRESLRILTKEINRLRKVIYRINKKLKENYKKD